MIRARRGLARRAHTGAADDELLALRDSPQHYEVPVDDGRFLLSGEVQVFWDAEPRQAKGNLRVMVDIWNDAGGRPLATDDFIRAPDGSFVDE